jgi:hypothetical protein
MKKKILNFDMYCYDTILINQYARILMNYDYTCETYEQCKYKYDEDIKYYDALCEAIKTNEYTVTLKALSRCGDHKTQIKLMVHYGFINI